MGYLIGGPSTYNETSSSLPQGKGFGLGNESESPNGVSYRYVKAGSAITSGDTVLVDESFSATPVTIANVNDAGFLAVASQAFASADYGWVAVAGGPVTIRLAASATADAPLYPSATAGVLDSAAASGALAILGAVAASAASAGGVSNVTGVLAYPAVKSV